MSSGSGPPSPGTLAAPLGFDLERHQLPQQAPPVRLSRVMIVPLLMIGLSSHFQPARMRQRPAVRHTAPHELESRPALVADALFDTVVELCEAHAAGADVGFERVPSLFDEVLRQDTTSKPRPVWPASAARAADWPRLAGAWGSLRHGPALQAASGAPAGPQG